jgi:hypothetical protein
VRTSRRGRAVHLEHGDLGFAIHRTTKALAGKARLVGVLFTVASYIEGGSRVPSSAPSR